MKPYIIFNPEKIPNQEIQKSLILEGAELIIKGLEKEFGLNLDENFKNTPERIYKGYKEIFQGLINTENEIAKIFSQSFPSDGYDSMIIASGIEAYSMCPHHLLPVFYNICVAYIPEGKDAGKVLGLSKLVRIVELLARRPVLQEKLTEDILRSLQRINPLGIAVVVKGEHCCMRIRGVKNPHSFIITSALEGCFKDDGACREEFFNLIKI